MKRVIAASLVIAATIWVVRDTWRKRPWVNPDDDPEFFSIVGALNA